MQSSGQKQPDTTTNQVEVTAPQNSTNAKLLHDQIMAEMQTDITKIIHQEVETIRTDFTTQLKALSTTTTKDFNSQIAKVIQTMQALNQCFNEVMECLPTLPTMPTHKKSKGLGIEK